MKPKLLVLELWGLGDLVIATPFLRAAVEKYEVSLLAQPFAAALRPRFWPEVEVLPFTAPWTVFHHKYQLWRWPWRKLSRLRRQLMERQFDYGVSARWDPRNHLLLKLSGARERFGYPRMGSQRFLTRSLTRPAPLSHRLEHWRVAGQALGLDLPSRETAFPSPPTLFPAVLVHTGAKTRVRVWPLDHYREIIRRLRQQGFPVRVVCDPDQLDWWRNQGEKVRCPRTIADLLDLLDECGVFIGNDSGPGHLAAACGRPTFTLFGPQLHEWFAPLHPASEVMEGKGCPYKPCSDYCRFAEPFCLWDITVEDVWPRVSDFVAKNLKAETGGLKS